MYHLFVKRFARRTFDRLTAGDWQPILDDLSPNVHHVYAGQNAVGGTRTSRDDVRRWFERVYRLFPSFHEEVREVLVGGWPWNTVAAVQWPPAGTPAPVVTCVVGSVNAGFVNASANFAALSKRSAASFSSDFAVAAAT